MAEHLSFRYHPVKVVYPLKQGLKQRQEIDLSNGKFQQVKVVYPLKQGLKLL